jgi:hypothetical protein
MPPWRAEYERVSVWERPLHGGKVTQPTDTRRPRGYPRRGPWHVSDSLLIPRKVDERIPTRPGCMNHSSEARSVGLRLMVDTANLIDL